MLSQHSLCEVSTCPEARGVVPDTHVVVHVWWNLARHALSLLDLTVFQVQLNVLVKHLTEG